MQNAAALQIQRVWRGHEDRQYFRMRRAVFAKAATTIQRVWKMYCVSVQLFAWFDHGAAVVIRNFLLQRLKAIEVMQRHRVGRV